MSFCNYLAKRFVNIPVYKGPYVSKGYFAPRKNQRDLEEAARYFKMCMESKDPEVSPFHVAFRTQQINKVEWTLKVKLRHLGLNSARPGVPVVLPNTPHFNALLWDVKHLIALKPIKFVNGFPSEADIGATRLCPFTGKFEINEAYRVDDGRVWADVPSDFYKGDYLRNYLRKLSGIFACSYS
ncbi:mitochondrial ribosomal protein L30 [Brevipalpus obovatus]|uniref:mitochondrial ribosomal protein L30 n=1 Tax=Brevipalpus obovatus TaxID=246614 RepID=UPI003D9F5974